MLDSPRYLPRKGTETVQVAAAIDYCCLIRHDIYPARGRKPACTSDTWSMSSSNSPRYLPRKGTETLSSTLAQISAPSTFATIFTPQGDGNCPFALVVAKKIPAIRHDIYPARGRKRRKCINIQGASCWSIRHDIYPARGRKLSTVLTFYWFSHGSPRYLPRKGTETFVIIIIIGLTHWQNSKCMMIVN